MGWHNIDNHAVLPALIQPNGKEDTPATEDEGLRYTNRSCGVTTAILIEDLSVDGGYGVTVEESPPRNSKSRGRCHRRCSLETVVGNDNTVDFDQYTVAEEEDLFLVGVNVRIIKGANEGKCGKITRLTDKCVFISIDGIDKDVKKKKSFEFVQIIPSSPVKARNERDESTRYVSDNEHDVDDDDDGDSRGDDRSVLVPCDVSVQKETYKPEGDAIETSSTTPQQSFFNGGIVSDIETDEEDGYESSDDDEEEDDEGECHLTLRAYQTITEGVLHENSVLLDKVKRLEDEKVKLAEDALFAKRKETAALEENENLKDRLQCPVCCSVKEDMYVFMTCGHKTCFDCFWNVGNKCPTCRRKLKKESTVMKRLY